MLCSLSGLEQKLLQRAAALQSSKEDEIALIRQHVRVCIPSIDFTFDSRSSRHHFVNVYFYDLYQFEQILKKKTDDLDAASEKLQQLHTATARTVDVGLSLLCIAYQNFILSNVVHCDVSCVEPARRLS